MKRIQLNENDEVLQREGFCVLHFDEIGDRIDVDIVDGFQFFKGCIDESHLNTALGLQVPQLFRRMDDESIVLKYDLGQEEISNNYLLHISQVVGDKIISLFKSDPILNRVEDPSTFRNFLSMVNADYWNLKKSLDETDSKLRQVESAYDLLKTQAEANMANSEDLRKELSQKCLAILNSKKDKIGNLYQEIHRLEEEVKTLNKNESDVEDSQAVTKRKRVSKTSKTKSKKTATVLVHEPTVESSDSSQQAIESVVQVGDNNSQNTLSSIPSASQVTQEYASLQEIPFNHIQSTSIQGRSIRKGIGFGL